MSTRIRTSAAGDQIRFARGYVRLFLEDLAPANWYWQPDEGVTHLAWQVGHLAVAQYSLALRRIRGESPADAELIPQDFRARFGKDSTPQSGAENNPSPEEILAVFDRVFDEVQQTLPPLTDEELDTPSEPSHPAFKTKLGSLFWAGQHELVHSGQIALLRRLMGKPPLR